MVCLIKNYLECDQLHGVVDRKSLGMQLPTDDIYPRARGWDDRRRRESLRQTVFEQRRW